MKETFKPIACHTTGISGYYCSNLGKIKKIMVKGDGSIVEMDPALCVNSGGYEYFNADGDRLFPHVEVWKAFNGDIPEGLTVDHINRVKWDSRLCNLRLLNKSQQAYNKEIPLEPKNLHVDKKGKVFFKMKICGKQITSPHFECPEDALECYKEYREQKVDAYREKLGGVYLDIIQAALNDGEE